MKGVNDLLSTYGLVHEVSKITYAAFERGKQYLYSPHFPQCSFVEFKLPVITALAVLLR